MSLIVTFNTSAGEDTLPHYKTLAGGKFVSPFAAKREFPTNTKGGGDGKGQYKKGKLLPACPIFPNVENILLLNVENIK